MAWYYGLIKYVIVILMITICFWVPLVGYVSTAVRDFTQRHLCYDSVGTTGYAGSPTVDELENR